MIMSRSSRDQHGCSHPSGRLWNKAETVDRYVPKPLIPLLDMTLIEHTIRILPRNIIQRVIIASGYGVDQMRAYFDNFDAGFEVIVVEEDQPLGTGGAIANCREHIRGPR